MLTLEPAGNKGSDPNVSLYSEAKGVLLLLIACNVKPVPKATGVDGDGGNRAKPSVAELNRTGSENLTVKLSPALRMLSLPKFSSMALTGASPGATVSTAWLARALRLAVAKAFPAASVRPVPTKLSATLPLVSPALGVTTTA